MSVQVIPCFARMFVGPDLTRFGSWDGRRREHGAGRRMGGGGLEDSRGKVAQPYSRRQDLTYTAGNALDDCGIWNIG